MRIAAVLLHETLAFETSRCSSSLHRLRHQKLPESWRSQACLFGNQTVATPAKCGWVLPLSNSNGSRSCGAVVCATPEGTKNRFGILHCCQSFLRCLNSPSRHDGERVSRRFITHVCRGQGPSNCAKLYPNHRHSCSIGLQWDDGHWCDTSISTSATTVGLLSEAGLPKYSYRVQCLERRRSAKWADLTVIVLIVLDLLDQHLEFKDVGSLFPLPAKGRVFFFDFELAGRTGFPQAGSIQAGSQHFSSLPLQELFSCGQGALCRLLYGLQSQIPNSWR